MKNSILKTALLFFALFLFTNANAQTCCSKQLANCPKKGTPECPVVKACADNADASKELAACPQAGTPECPLIKNCALKGTAACPYTAGSGKTAATTASKDKEVPECCKKKG